MKNLDKRQKAKLDELQRAIALEEPKLKAAIDEYNATIKAAFEKLHNLIGGYERAQGEFDHLHSEIGQAIMEFAGEAGDWQESEEGQRYLDWLSAWTDAAVFPLNFKQPPDLTVPKSPLSAIIAALPRGPGDVEQALGEPEGPDPSLNQLRSTTIREDWARIADFAQQTFQREHSGWLRVRHRDRSTRRRRSWAFHCPRMCANPTGSTTAPARPRL